MKLQLTNFWVMVLLPVIGFSQTAITDIDAAYRSVTDDVNRYSDGGDNYSFGVGASGNDNLLFEDFYIPDGSGGSTYFAIESLADRIELRRVDNDGTTGERHIIFFEQESNSGNGSGTDYDLRPEFVGTMEEALRSRLINRGSDNVFANQGGDSNLNNIERIDFIFEEGITVPADSTEQGFLILERGGNDDFNIAPITSLDASNDPDGYGTVIQASQNDWVDSSTSVTTDVLNGFSQITHTANVPSQPIAGMFFSFADLGFSPGDTVYGYSLAGGDTTTNSTDFISFTTSTFFPTDTSGGSSGNGGLDLVAGGGVVERAFIHNSSGWVDDPSGLSDCDELIIVTGGTATLTANTQIGKISVDNGASIDASPVSPDTENYNLDICKEVEALSDFEATNINVNFIEHTTPASVQQNIVSGQRASIDSVTVDNSNGLLLEGELGIKDALRLNNGAVTTNSNLVFESNSTETGQLSPLNGGSISGDVVAERWIEDQRAFRLLSSPLNAGTIYDNWQEGADDYQHDHNPGFGTHITGNNTSQTNNTSNNGFDWQPSGDPSLFTWDNSTQTWSAKTDNTDETNLNSADPYRIMVRGDRSIDVTDNETTPTETVLRSTGTIQTGTQTLSGGFNNTADAYNFFGNPYQAAVDMSQVLDNTRTGTTNVNETYMYVWDTSLGTRGGFACIDVTNSANNCPSSTNASKYLQPGQAAFFITDDPISGSSPGLEFQESDISTDEANETPTIFSDSGNASVYFELFTANRYQNGDKPQDAVRFGFSSSFSDNITSKDAEQIGNLEENFSVYSNQKVLTIEKRSLPQLGDSHQLYTWPFDHQDYMMTAVVQNIDPNLPVTLVDNYTETAVQLDPGFNEYSFQIDPNVPESAAWNRFNLVFDNVTLGTESNELENDLSIFPNPVTDGSFTIRSANLSGQDTEVRIYDTLGKQVHQTNREFTTGKISIDRLDLSAGVYFVKVNANGQTFREKLIVK